MFEYQAATFTRLHDGSWGLRVVSSDAPPRGFVLTVTRRRAPPTTAVASKVVGRWTTPDGGAIWYCSIASQEEAAALAARPNTSTDTRVTGADLSIPEDDSIPF